MIDRNQAFEEERQDLQTQVDQLREEIEDKDNQID